MLTPYGNWGGPSWGKILLRTQLRFCPPGKPILIFVVFVGGFKLAYIFGLPREAETYVPSKAKDGQVMDYRDPVANLFRVVETNIDGAKLASAVVVDLDGNRRYDLVAKDTDGRLRAWMNKPDGWKEDPTSLPDLDFPVNFLRSGLKV